MLIHAYATATVVFSQVLNSSITTQQSRYSESLTHLGCPSSLPPYPIISKRAMISITLLLGGAILRLVCMRTLGGYFTWEVAVLPNHKLITSGPYSVVRHPSYTGGFAFRVGVVMYVFAEGTFFRDCVMKSYLMLG